MFHFLIGPIIKRCLTRTGLVVDVPLLNAGQTVGMCAGQNDVWLAFQAYTTFVKGIRIDVVGQLVEE